MVKENYVYRSLVGIPRCQFGGTKHRVVFIIANESSRPGVGGSGGNLVTNFVNREQCVTSVWRCRKSCSQRT